VCESDGCRIRLDLPFVAISCDRTRLLDQPDGRKPDFVVAAVRATGTDPIWLVLELKSGHADPGELRDQLHAGLSIVRNCTPPAPAQWIIAPMAITGPVGQRVAALLADARYGVAVQGRKQTIFVGRCGDSISELIDGFLGARPSARSSKRSRRR
jgi:hypothetical protein